MSLLLGRASRGLLLLSAFFPLAAGIAGGQAPAPAQAEPAASQDRILIRPKPDVSPEELAQLHEALGGQPLRTFSQLGNIQVLRVPDGTTVDEALERYRSSGRFEYSEPDYIIKLDLQPNDPRFTDGSLWGLHNTGQNGGTDDADIDAPEGWDVLHSASNVVVAVIDTGIRYTHEDLAANMWSNPGEVPNNGIDDDGNGYVDDVHGINAITNSGNPNDDHFHGTHVAGTIGAVGNNGKGVVGVAWKVQLMACKFLSSGGSGTTSDAIQCVDYARSNGARIMSNSWGGGGYSQALRDAIAAARDAGIIFVSAAGNSASNNDTYPHYPSSYDVDNVVAVASTTRTDSLSSFSSYGPTSVDLGAPGSNILSTWNSSDSAYDTISGTSMATPHVSGVFALMAARFPDETYLQLIDRVFKSTDPLPALAGKIKTGGRLNLHKALNSYPPPGPTLSVDDVAVSEGNSGSTSAVFTVTLALGPPGQTVTVSYATADGTASAGQDYVATSGSLSFAPGETTKTVVVTVDGDGLGEANETFFLNLSGATGANIGDGQGRATINNDDISALSIDDVAVVEGSSGTTSAVFTVSMTPANSQTVTVDYATANGTADSGRSSYANATAISIPDSGGSSAPATPYPSTIAVPALPGAVTKATVMLSGLSHTYPQDVDILLVGPAGQAVVLMSDVGFFNDTINVDLTFDDAGPPLTTGPIVSGTYKPTNLNDYEGLDSYPPPAPSGTYGNALSVFNGANAAGTWRLFVVDDYAYVDGGSIAGGWSLTLHTNGATDYVFTSGTLTFPPGATTRTLSVPVTGDGLGELDETFFVNLSHPKNAVIADGQGQGTILNDDPPMLGVGDAAVVEGDTGTADAVFTVSLTPASTQPVTVSYATADGTAVAGSDYVAQSGTLTFAPGETAKTITVPVNGETSNEGEETFFLNLSNAGVPITDGQGLGTIVDDDEGDGLRANYYSGLSLLGSPFATRVDPTVDFDWGAGGPVPGLYVDYWSARWVGRVLPKFSETYTFYTRTDDGVRLWVNGQLLIDKWIDQGPTEWSGAIALQAGQRYDIKMEYYEKAGGAVAQLLWSSASTPKAVIPKNWLFSTAVSIDPPNAYVYEGGSGTTKDVAFDVTLSAPSKKPVSVNYATANGTASAGSDYQPTSGVLTFAPGEQAKTVTVTVLGDNLGEANETFFVNLTAGANAVIEKGSSQGTILNDDHPAISINDVTVTEGDTGTTNAVFTVSMSPPSGQTVTVDYATINGTAASGGDYLSSSGTLTFAPEATTRTISVPVKGDTLSELNETFFVNLTHATNASIVDAIGQATILNDDPPALSIGDATVSEGNAGTVGAVFTVSLIPPGSQTVTVNYATANGSAVAPYDYVSTSGTLTFLPGESSKAVTVLVAGDLSNEDDETFSLNLSNATGATIADGQGVGTIVEDDLGDGLKGSYYNNMTFSGTPFVRVDSIVGVNWGGGSPAPGIGSDFFSVRWTGQVKSQFSESYQFCTVSDDGVRLWVNNQLLINRWIDQAPTEWCGQIALQAGQRYDVKLEYYENVGGAMVQLFWSSPSTPKAIIPQNRLYTPPPVLSAADASVVEGNTGTAAMAFTVSLTPASGQTVTVDYATASGTATTPADYSPASGTLTFLAGETTKTVTVLVNGDLLDEGDETVFLNLSNASGVPIGDGQGVGTIVDDDGGDGLKGSYYANTAFSGTPVVRVDSTVNFNWGGGSPAAGIGSDFFSVRWTGQVKPQFSEVHQFCTVSDDGVRLWVSNQLLVNAWVDQGPTQYCGSIALQAGQRYDVKLEYYENAGGAVAQLFWSSPSTPKAIVPKNRLYSSPPPALYAGDASVVEGNTGTAGMVFTVSLTPVSSQTVSVDYATANGTATAPADYQAVSGTLTFLAGETSKTVTVLVNGDTLDEGDETLFLNLSNASGVPIGDGQGVGTIVDDDGGDGLKGSYYGNTTFGGAPVVRVDSTVNFNWGGGSPVAGIGSDFFSVRWTGQVKPQFSESYQFCTVSDDGVRLWVNNQLLVNAWVDQGPTQYCGSIALQAGQRYDVKLEYYENGGGAVAQLFWSSPSTPKAIVPKSRLYSSPPP